MAQYQFAEKDGTIVTEEYDGTTYLSIQQVNKIIQDAFSIFPIVARVSNVDGYDDAYQVFFPSNEFPPLYICAKGTTPGGRFNLLDEQRIQPKAKYINYVYEKGKKDATAVLLGIYKRKEEVVFCAWLANESNASSEDTPISKQIKISTIATAIKEGFARQVKQNGEYVCAFKPSFLYFYLRNKEWLHHDRLLSSESEHESLEISIDESLRKSGGENILLYGVPGSGKSWTIEHEYCKPESSVERLVFHPDYTNADFIGQILPDVDTEHDNQVTYKFCPGPFTQILKDAYKNPKDEFILIIEEINRGNAPAIFGETFQLLDRMVEDDPKNGLNRGTSEYGITNENMAEIIYDDKHHKVRIPSNLSIIGTMNTSDQNVFTLDTAFQRRWRMRLIENNFDRVRSSLAEAQILDTGVTWQRFCETINGYIVGNKAKMASAEDKRLGVYFIHENDIVFDKRAVPSNGFLSLLEEYNHLIELDSEKADNPMEKSRLNEIQEAVMQNRLFPEKVLKYLWDDAFKFNPEAVFDTVAMDSLEKVIRTFIYSAGEDRFKVFSESVRENLLHNGN